MAGNLCRNYWRKVRRRRTEELPENFAGTVRFCDAHCRKDLVKGYMMAPWTRTFAIHEQKSMEAVAQMASVISAR